MINYNKFTHIYKHLKSQSGGTYSMNYTNSELDMSSDKQSLFFSPKIISFDKLNGFIISNKKGLIKGNNLVNKNEQFEINFGTVQLINVKNGYYHLKLSNPIPNNIDFKQKIYFELL